MFASDANPALRIRIIGTGQVLGIDVGEDLSLRQVPANVRRLWRPLNNLLDGEVQGNFLVCTDMPRPNRMPMVKVERASNLVLVRTRSP